MFRGQQERSADGVDNLARPVAREESRIALIDREKSADSGD
jgi:hypothetical protein